MIKENNHFLIHGYFIKKDKTLDLRNSMPTKLELFIKYAILNRKYHKLSTVLWIT